MSVRKVVASVVEDDDSSCPSADMRRTVGAALAAARLEAGLTIEDVSGRLNLRSSFIVAVEEGRGHEHMDWVYERNHIRAMAAIVSMDLPETLEGAQR
jgi:cytoskeletal protein RodZ